MSCYIFDVFNLVYVTSVSRLYNITWIASWLGLWGLKLAEFNLALFS